MGGEIARTLRDLYEWGGDGIAFLIDGFVPDEVLEYWLRQGALGQTSNQTLFLQRVQEGALDEAILRLHREGLTPPEIFNRLYDQEALRSAEALRRWVGREEHLGISRETDALRASDHEAVVKEAVTLQRLSPLLFVKLANFGACQGAVRSMICHALVRAAKEGVTLNPNITLVFGFHHYLNTVAGFLDGLETLADMGFDPTPIRSVNSLFISRLDVATDDLIERQKEKSPEKRGLLEMLKGKAGIAHAKFVYRLYRTIFFGEPLNDPLSLLSEDEKSLALGAQERWQRLKGRFLELRPQRLLLASTSNKKPGVYSELLYVLPLLGHHLANTLPLKTLQALEEFLRGSGIPLRATIKEAVPWMEQRGETVTAWEEAVLNITEVPTKTPDEVLHLLEVEVYRPQGTSLRALTDVLRDKGAEAFARDQRRAYALFAERIAVLTGQG